MSQATGYSILFPPEVTSNETSAIAVVLVGGDGLDAALTVTLDGGSSVALDGPIVIQPGSTWGSTRFRATGSASSTSIAATHSGGNSGMGNPASAPLTIRGPIAVTDSAANTFSVAIVTPVPGYSPSDYPGSAAWPLAREGKVGEAQIVYVRVGPGSTLSSPLVVTLADDAGGTFAGNPVTIAGSPGYALARYTPTTAGLRTITVSSTGGGGLVHYPVQYGLSTDLRFYAAP